MGQYLPIVVLTVLAVLFGILSLFASRLLAPRRPNSAKEAPYECGIVPGREPPERFPVSFYVIAMLFIMFDIEIIFAYPYAIDYQFLGPFVFFEMAAFSAVFFISFVYMIARGALDWGPIQRVNDIADIADGPTLTPRRSVKVVGREGRESESGRAA
jgi:NADH-quinone oxidoreductase subunit A